MTDSPEPEEVSPNQFLQNKLAQCYECFLSVTSSITETEYRQRVERLKCMLAELTQLIQDRAPAQARCQMLIEMEQIMNHRQQVLGRLEGAWGAAQNLISTAENAGKD